jgi:hypothetical protein
MIDGLAYAVMGLALVATGWGILTASLNKPPGRAQIGCAAAVVLVVIVQTVIAGVRIGMGDRPDELATTIGYLIGIVLLIPVAGLWALSERTRFSGVVLAVAAFSVLAMTLRLQVLWTGGA